MSSPMPGTKLFQRALKIPHIQELLRGMQVPEDQSLQFLSCCYNCVAKYTMDLERGKFREAPPLDALIAAVEMVHSGEFQLVEDENGDIMAIPHPSLLKGD